MSKRRRAGAGRRIAEQRFWGVGPNGAGQAPAHQSGPGQNPDGPEAAGTGSDVAATASATPPTAADTARATSSNGASGSTAGERIRPTTDPAAVVRSLGPPPFAIDGSVAERHLAAVYEEAVRAATALAAANGLLAEEEGEDV
jgi:hypothetical protein